MTIGERIKERRQELGLSQDELAKKVGYKSRSSINKLELSRELPSRKITLMAKALDTTEAYLMGWDDGEDTIILELYRNADEVTQEAVKRLLAYSGKLSN